MSDLRDLVEAHLGKPLAASTHTGLWRCPACSPERHALLLVSVDEYHWLRSHPCHSGAYEWTRNLAPKREKPLLIEVPA